MKTSNVVSENLRVVETALQWEEQITNNQATLVLLPCQTFRVRATGATTVTIDGVLAATMTTGEIMLFNTGQGNRTNTNLPTVSVVIGGANAYVQVGREVKRPRTVVNPFNAENPFNAIGDQSQ